MSSKQSAIGIRFDRSTVDKIEDGVLDNNSQKQRGKEKRSSLLAIVVNVSLVLFGLTLYAASAGAISCRLLDKMIKAQSCHVTIRPFSNLWQASIYAMLAVNAAAAALFLQGLMMGFRIGHGNSFQRNHGGHPIGFRRSLFSESPLDGNVFRLVYKTRCSDDVVIRVQLPALSNYHDSKKSRSAKQGTVGHGRLNDLKQQQKQQQKQQLKRQNLGGQTGECATERSKTQDNVPMDNSGPSKNG